MSYELEGAERWLHQWRQEGTAAADDARVRRWLDGLRDDPRQAPSAASSREHPHSQDELRGAFLLDAGGTFVVYAVDEVQRIVRVLHIGSEPPEDIVFRLPD